MPSLKSRLEALEAAAWHKARARSVSRVYVNPSAAEQAEIDKARAAGQFVLVVRGEPFPLDPSLDQIVEVPDETKTPSLRYDKTPMRAESRVAIW